MCQACLNKVLKVFQGNFKFGSMVFQGIAVIAATRAKEGIVKTNIWSQIQFFNVTMVKDTEPNLFKIKSMDYGQRYRT